MASSTQEPLIPSPIKNPTTLVVSCKAISLITLSIASLICAVTIITLLQTSPINHVTEFQPSALCTDSPNFQSCHAVVAAAAAALRSQIPVPSPIHILYSLINQSSVQLDRTAYVAATTATTHQSAAIADCIHLIDLSHDRLLDSAAAIADGAHTDARTWLSAALTNYGTCLDGLDGRSSPINARLHLLSELASASLAVLNAVSPHGGGDVAEPSSVSKFPTWVVRKDRKLLEASSLRAVIDRVNVTVAADGSGDFATVQAAVDSAPDKGKGRYVIYVKSGTYVENVAVGQKKTNVMIIGDGLNSTVITGSRNVIDGSTTFNSATLAAVGEGFILQDMCIENTAGPAKHQAVALRVGADLAVINRCQIRAYQDTLYAHSLRQFYRDCYISGTVDFIFGNAAVVIQNCTLIARLPMANQQNLVTAQGRTDPNQNTGTSLHLCQVVPSDDLLPMQATIPTYLGRPWKNFSRTVYMRSYIDSHIRPRGWLEWDGAFALDTLYYGEFENFGPGAGVAGRVNWTGYHIITDPAVANEFTVAEFIQGGVWLRSTGVEFTEGL